MPTSYTDNLNGTNTVLFMTYDGRNGMNEFYTSGTSSVFPTNDKNFNRNYYGNSSGSSGISKITLNSGTNQFKQLFTGTGGSTLFNTLTTDARGSITAFSPGYGTQAVTGMSYNNAGQLASVSGSSGTLGSYIYDGKGQRFSKTVGTTTTTFQYGQGGGVLAETNGTTETNYIYMNGRPIAMLTGSTFLWLHDDKIGMPRVATDSGQSAQWHGNYLPFGEPIAVTGTATVNLRMPGQYFDAESGFHHNGARDYVPSLGRYLQADPVGLYDFGTAEGLNPYNYAGQNPLFMTDPSGLLSTGGMQIPQQSNGAWCAINWGPPDGKTLHWYTIALDGTGKLIDLGIAESSTPPPGCAGNVAVHALVFACGPTAECNALDAIRWTAIAAIAGNKQIYQISQWPYSILPQAQAASELGDAPTPSAAEEYEEGSFSWWHEDRWSDNPSLRDEWSQENGTPWPKDPDTGNNQDVHHVVPLADGGPDHVSNVDPLTRNDHTLLHMLNGDFIRWGR
jgi:RHS repeat-associated protein